MAGLFALVCGLFTVGCKYAVHVNDNVKKYDAIKYAKEHNQLVYYIGSKEYFLANDIPCRTRYAENGHKVIEGVGKYYGKLLYDYDAGKEIKLQDEYSQALNKAISEGKKYIDITKYEGDYVNTERGSSVYLEIETNQKYTITKTSGGYLIYYLDEQPIYKPRLYGGGNVKVKFYNCKKDSNGNYIYKFIDNNDEYYRRLGLR